VRVVVGACPQTSSPAPGQPASELPDVTLPCLGHDGTVSLAGLTGPLVVNLWASWCIPCQREVPALQNVYEEARGRFGVLGVDLEDTDASALDFARAVGMRYPSVVDRNADVLRQLGFPGPPVTLFLAADGEVVYRSVGEQTERELRDNIRKHLQVAV
jgi:thiol-disulfide isomerase/thioredoxin